MQIKSILGVVLTGVALFLFGFLYWGVNTLPYQAWNSVADPAAAQTAASTLFPDDGIYFVPGPTNEPATLKLFETGPAFFVTIDHTPIAGPDPAALAMGLVHNILAAGLLLLVLSRLSGMGSPVATSIVIGLCACFIINGSEIIWWMQPVGWIIYQVVYYLIYFAIAGFLLGYFMPKKTV